MLGNSHFYHESIKKYITSFSHIFSDIHINRVDSLGTLVKDVKIPLSYGQKTKLFNILSRNSNIDRKIDHFLPRLDFELTTISPDPTRQWNVTNDIDKIVDDDVNFTFNGISYNFGFEVNLVCAYLDDMYQALEQILASFTPDYQNLKIDLIPELDIVANVKVILTNVSTDINVDIGEDDFRSCEATLEFELQGYLFKSIKTSGKIKEVILNLNDSETEKTWSILTSTLQPDDVTIIDSIVDYDQ